MGKVIIIINAEIEDIGLVLQRSPVTQKMVTSLKQAIAGNNSRPQLVEVVTASSLWSKSSKGQLEDKSIVYCPLTIELPYWLKFPGQEVFQACKAIQERRLWVQENLNYQVSKGNNCLGDLWLPILITKKGKLYAEVIEEGEMPNFYRQPVQLPDEFRKPLYSLAEQLLDNLAAPPSVYLLQFSLRNREIIFDRLWPFPAAPAIASLNVQQPNLFACYWYCLTGQPISNVKTGPKKIGH